VVTGKISLLQTFRSLRWKMGPGEARVLSFIIAYLFGAAMGASVMWLHMKEKEKI
jgi:hypothetical protein